MPINPVMEALYAAFQLEIANQFTFTKNALRITLPDQTYLIVRAYHVNPVASPAMTHSISVPKHAHTYHFLHLHDFNNAQDTDRLVLQSLEDCCAYIDDVCRNLLNATLRDLEVTFPDGTAYLITVEKER